MRWKLLPKTTPSGKSLFRCTICGRESPTPDKKCETFDRPYNQCEQTEKDILLAIEHLECISTYSHECEQQFCDYPVCFWETLTHLQKRYCP